MQNTRFWGGHQTNANDRILNDWVLSTSNIEILKTEGPSRVTPTRDSFIDVFLTTNQISLEDPRRAITGTGDCNSDHRAVFLDVLLNNIDNEEPEKIFDFADMGEERQS